MSLKLIKIYFKDKTGCDIMGHGIRETSTHGRVGVYVKTSPFHTYTGKNYGELFKIIKKYY